MELNSAEASKRNETPNEISYVAEPRRENSYIPVASFDLLNTHTCHLKRSRNGKASVQCSQRTIRASSRKVLSAESISRVAKLKLLNHSERNDDLQHLKEPSESQRDIDYDFQDIELALDLTLAAEKISNGEFNDAEKLLSSCHNVSETAATPVQKVVQYFAEALRERIDIDKGQIDIERKTVQIQEFPTSEQPDRIACEMELPFNQITGFVTTQAIMESMGSAARIHIIDFSVRSGSHWPILMHAIAYRENCPLELLKITAVGASRKILEETGRWLSSFAESISLPFSFHTVSSELGDFKMDFLELKSDEVVAVFMNVCVWPLLARPDRLEAFIGAIIDLNPLLVAVAEMEVNTNTSVFLHRFYEGLFHCSAVFDSFEICLTDDQFRKMIEEVNIQNAIRDIIISDGEERIYRHAKIDFWKELFSRFGLVEMELSHWSLIQTSLLLKSCSCWSSCSIIMNGKSMIVRWKGTPINSFSAWKFPRD